MSPLKKIVTLAILVCLLPLTSAQSASPESLSPELLQQGWIQLFDGHSLFGWRKTSDANWRVEEGAIVVDKGERGFLLTTSQFQDYELHFEFKAAEGTNSGVFLRTPVKPKNPAQDCYELNIAPLTNPFPTGSLVGRQRSADTEYPAETWHQVLAKVDGDTVQVAINGKTVLSYEEPQPLPRNSIGLQLNRGQVAFRHIRLRPLGLKPIFNGRDLSGWSTDQRRQSTFSVTDKGELRVQNGSGQIESKGTYGNFLLQLECFVNGEALNSGLFFRCIPGDYMNGYESQIHNGHKEGDPTEPIDAGTGAIYRRTKARRVVAEDFEWFHKTIIADGPHIAVWVNGYPVTDWIDTRDKHENPRQGLRLKPGTLAIQGHDPTTDLKFRGLRIKEFLAKDETGDE